MAEEGELSPKGIEGTLTRKVGPLPLYAWGGIAAAGMAVLFYALRKKSGATAAATAAPSAGTNSGSALQSAGLSGGGGTYTGGNTYVCPDGSYASDPSQCPGVNAPPVGTNVSCPPGQIYVTGAGCTSPGTSCPSGQYWNGSACVPVASGTAPTSTAPPSGSAPSCGPGQIYVTGQGCIYPGGQSQCAPGYHNNGQGCVPGGTTVMVGNPGVNPCPPGEQFSLTNGCQPEYVPGGIPQTGIRSALPARGVSGALASFYG